MPNEINNQPRRVSAVQAVKRKQMEEKLEKFWFQQTMREAAQQTESKQKTKEVKK